jgi:hypothetical protein
MIDEGDIPSIECKMSHRGPKSMRKVDGLSLNFINFYFPAFIPRLNIIKTSLQLSDKRIFFAVCRIKALVLSLIYPAVTWQWVYMSQHTYTFIHTFRQTDK